MAFEHAAGGIISFNAKLSVVATASLLPFSCSLSFSMGALFFINVNDRHQLKWLVLG